MDGGASRRSLVGSSRLVPPCRGLRGRPWHVCSLCSSCAPLAEAIACGDGPAQSTHTAPHRPVDASHSVPIAGGDMELELACAAVLGTLPSSGKARRARCARRDCPGAPLDSHTPPRRARPTRRVPHLSQAVRSSWALPCGEGRAPCRLRAGRVARVVLAETAWVRPGAESHPCVSSRRRV